MKLSHDIAFVLLLSAAYIAVSPAIADAAQQLPTIVTVKKLCPNCGKKIAQKLSELPQVEGTTINVEQRTIQVRCIPGGIVSPRTVWEIVERGGEQPIKLQSPLGTFTTKPQQ